MVLLLTIALVLASGQKPPDTSDVRKAEFIKLLTTLQMKHEFYPEEAITKVEPYLPVFLSLAEKDVEGYDIYPFAALSRGLCDRKKNREYVVRHFQEIRHPAIKLFWAAMLFDADSSSPEIQEFLKSALHDEGKAKLLSEMLGPKFADFKKRVIAHSKS